MTELTQQQKYQREYYKKNKAAICSKKRDQYKPKTQRKTIREAVHFVDGRENNCGVATHEWKGIKGVDNIAKAIGTTHTTIYKHMKAGCTIDEAVAKVQKSHKRAEQVRKLRAKSTAKPIEQVGIKKPTEVPELWRLALGFGG